MQIEQTQIAKQLGMSNKKFRLMVEGKIDWTLINNKRHYEMNEVLKLIKIALKENIVNG